MSHTDRRAEPVPAGPAPKLPPQYLAVLRHAANGATDREIADALGRPVDTVKWQMKAVFAALGAASRTHAVALAMAGGLLAAADVLPAAPRAAVARRSSQGAVPAVIARQTAAGAVS